MASGSYARKPLPQQPLQVSSPVPARRTRQLSETSLVGVKTESETEPIPFRAVSKTIESIRPAIHVALPFRPSIIVEQFRPHPLEQHKSWLTPLVVCMIGAVVCLLIVLSAGVFQRPQGSALLNYTGGKVYDLQVGGNLASTWQASQPMTSKVPIQASNSPYTVLGKPTISVAMINRILTAYNSPAAGMGQSLYNLGVQYDIDPVFALAFFMHESTFGTEGEAKSSLSLGNLRCIPNAQCIDNYAWFSSWEAGFQAWYELIRNLYVAQWGLTTIDQIIPRYAPPADNNNDNAYISSLKLSIDTWHAGQVMVQ